MLHFIGHALCHDVKAAVAEHFHYMHHHTDRSRARSRIWIVSLDQTAIQLDDIDRHAHEVAQGGIAAAKVIQCNAQAQ